VPCSAPDQPRLEKEGMTAEAPGGRPCRTPAPSPCAEQACIAKRRHHHNPAGVQAEPRQSRSIPSPACCHRPRLVHGGRSGRALGLPAREAESRRARAVPRGQGLRVGWCGCRRVPRPLAVPPRALPSSPLPPGAQASPPLAARCMMQGRPAVPPDHQHPDRSAGPAPAFLRRLRVHPCGSGGRGRGGSAGAL